MSRPKKNKNKSSGGAPEPKIQASTPVPEKKEGGILDFVEKYAMQFTLLLIVITGYFIFKDYLLLKKIYLFTDIGSDSINTYYPNYVSTADYLREHGLPQWSHNSGMGQSIFAYSVGDIFNDIYYLLGRGNMHFGFVYVEFIKIILAGMFFFSFLRILNISRYAAIFGALAYAFNGYMMLTGSGWPNISTECVIASALLLSFEKFYLQQKWYFLTLVFAYITAMQPFNLYIFGLLLLIYSVFRLMIAGESNRNNILFLYFKTGGFALLGIGIASIFFVSNVWVLLQSPRVSGDAGYTNALSGNYMLDRANPIEYISILCRLFSNDLLGNATQFKGWNNYLESPILCSTLAALLLAPQYFVLTAKRNRKIILVLFAAALIPFIFPYFRYLFWLFTGNYYRALGLMMLLFILFFAVVALNKIIRSGKISVPALGGTLLFLFVILFMNYGNKNQIIDTGLRSTICFFLIVHAIILLLLKNSSLNELAKILLLLVTTGELIFMGSITANKRDTISTKMWNEKWGYNDYSVEASQYLKQIDNSFYRVSKDYSSNPSKFTSFNDAMVQQYNGTMSYNSFNQKYFIEFLQSVNVIKPTNEIETRWAPGLNNRPLLQTLTAHKYLFSKNPKLFAPGIGHDSIAKFGDVRVLKNKFFVPLGVTFNKIIAPADFKRMADFQKDVALLKAVVPDSSDMQQLNTFKQLSLKDSVNPYSFEIYARDIGNLKKDTLAVSEFTPNKISGTIKTDSTKILFMAIPYDLGWHAIIDGAEQKIMKVNNGLMGVLLTPGKHSVEFDYTSVFLKEGFIATLISLCLFLFLILKFKRIRSI